MYGRGCVSSGPVKRPRGSVNAVAQRRRLGHYLCMAPGIPRPPGPFATDELDERARRVLSAVVRDYVETGDPVGSKTIARRKELDASSATVRAVMAHLEAPRAQADRLQRIEFVGLREGRILAVLITRSGAVQNRLLLPEPGNPPLTPAQLEQGANWLNGILGALTLPKARARLRGELDKDRALLEEVRAR